MTYNLAKGDFARFEQNLNRVRDFLSK